MSTNKNLNVKVWSGTRAHMSLDTRIHKRLVEVLCLNGFDANYRGDWSIERLVNGKKAIVTHHARGAYKYRYTPAQTDAEEILIDMQTGKLPEGIVAYVTAHCHTSEGSIDHEGIKIIRCPCFTTFIPYGNSLKKFAHYQPDIGGWFIIVTKTGRIRVQEWLYPTFLYHEIDDEIIIAKKTNRSYASIRNNVIEPHLQALIDGAKRVILVLADTHIGEQFSVAPPSFKYGKRKFSGPMVFNKCNRRLWRYFKHLAKIAVNGFKINELWLVGDIFSGTNPFEKYRMPNTSNLDLQVYQALELFKQFKSP